MTRCKDLRSSGGIENDIIPPIKRNLDEKEKTEMKIEKMITRRKLITTAHKLVVESEEQSEKHTTEGTEQIEETEESSSDGISNVSDDEDSDSTLCGASSSYEFYDYRKKSKSSDDFVRRHIRSFMTNKQFVDFVNEFYSPRNLRTCQQHSEPSSSSSTDKTQGKKFKVPSSVHETRISRKRNCTTETHCEEKPYDRYKIDNPGKLFNEKYKRYLSNQENFNVEYKKKMIEKFAKNRRRRGQYYTEARTYHDEESALADVFVLYRSMSQKLNGLKNPRMPFLHRNLFYVQAAKNNSLENSEKRVNVVNDRYKNIDKKYLKLAKTSKVLNAKMHENQSPSFNDKEIRRMAARLHQQNLYKNPDTLSFVVKFLLTETEIAKVQVTIHVVTISEEGDCFQSVVDKFTASTNTCLMDYSIDLTSVLCCAVMKMSQCYVVVRLKELDEDEDDTETLGDYKSFLVWTKKRGYRYAKDQWVTLQTLECDDDELILGNKDMLQALTLEQDGDVNMCFSFCDTELAHQYPYFNFPQYNYHDHVYHTTPDIPYGLIRLVDRSFTATIDKPSVPNKGNNSSLVQKKRVGDFDSNKQTNKDVKYYLSVPQSVQKNKREVNLLLKKSGIGYNLFFKQFRCYICRKLFQSMSDLFIHFQSAYPRLQHFKTKNADNTYSVKVGLNPIFADIDEIKYRKLSRECALFFSPNEIKKWRTRLAKATEDQLISFKFVGYIQDDCLRTTSIVFSKNPQAKEVPRPVADKQWPKQFSEYELVQTKRLLIEMADISYENKVFMYTWNALRIKIGTYRCNQLGLYRIWKFYIHLHRDIIKSLGFIPVIENAIKKQALEYTNEGSYNWLGQWRQKDLLYRLNDEKYDPMDKKTPIACMIFQQMVNAAHAKSFRKREKMNELEAALAQQSVRESMKTYEGCVASIYQILKCPHLPWNHDLQFIVPKPKDILQEFGLKKIPIEFHPSGIFSREETMEDPARIKAEAVLLKQGFRDVDEMEEQLEKLNVEEQNNLCISDWKDHLNL